MIRRSSSSVGGPTSTWASSISAASGRIVVSAAYWSARTTSTTWMSRAASRTRSTSRAASASAERLAIASSNWSTTSSCGPGSSSSATPSSAASGIVPGDDHRRPPRPLARQPPAAHQRQQAGAHQRRLPAAGRPDDRDQPPVQHPRGELGDEPLAADEQVGVLRPVGREGAVRVAAGQARVDELVAPGPGGDEGEHLVEHGGVGFLRRRAGAERGHRRGLEPVAGGALGPRRRLPPGHAGQPAGDGDVAADGVVVDPVGDDDAGEVLVGQRSEGGRRRGREPAQRADGGPTAGGIGDQHEQEREPLGGSRHRLEAATPAAASIRRRRPRAAAGPRRQRSVTASTTAPGGTGASGDPGVRVEIAEVGAAPHVLDPAALGDHLGGELGRQAGAPAVGRPEQHAHLAGAAPGQLPRLGQPRQLGAPADEWAGRAQRRRQRRPVAGDDQLRILVEDLPFEGAQFRAGLQAERLGERAPRPLVGDEGVVLAAGGVQRPHQQRPRPLPPGLLDDEPFEIGDRHRRRAARQLGLGEILHRPQPQLVEADPFGGGELGVAELGVRRAPPEPERLGEQGRRRRRGPPGELATPVGGEPLEPHGVHRGGVDGEPVAAADRLDQLRVGRAERAAQADDVGLDRLRRGRRGILAPQGVDDGVDGHHASRAGWRAGRAGGGGGSRRRGPRDRRPRRRAGRARTRGPSPRGARVGRPRPGAGRRGSSPSTRPDAGCSRVTPERNPSVGGPAGRAVGIDFPCNGGVLHWTRGPEADEVREDHPR